MIYGGKFQNSIFLGVKFTFQTFFLIVDFVGVKMFYVRNNVLNKLCKFRCSNVKQIRVIHDLLKNSIFSNFDKSPSGSAFSIFKLK